MYNHTVNCLLYFIIFNNINNLAQVFNATLFADVEITQLAPDFN